MNKNNIKNYVNKDDLFNCAIDLDSMKYLMHDVLAEYFDEYDPSNGDDQLYIIYSFPRIRGKFNAIFKLFNSVIDTFEKQGIMIQK